MLERLLLAVSLGVCFFVEGCASSGSSVTPQADTNIPLITESPKPPKGAKANSPEFHEWSWKRGAYLYHYYGSREGYDSHMAQLGKRSFYMFYDRREAERAQNRESAAQELSNTSDSPGGTLPAYQPSPEQKPHYPNKQELSSMYALGPIQIKWVTVSPNRIYADRFSGAARAVATVNITGDAGRRGTVYVTGMVPGNYRGYVTLGTAVFLPGQNMVEVPLSFVTSQSGEIPIRAATGLEEDGDATTRVQVFR